MRIGIVGAGVSGMTAAWLLQDAHRVTLLEKAPRLGGHVESLRVEVGGKTVDAEFGPRFFFDPAYPYFLALLRVLRVPIRWDDFLVSFTELGQGHTIVLPPRSLRHVSSLLRSPRLIQHVLSLRRLIEEQPGIAARRDYSISFRRHLEHRGYPLSFGPEFAFPFLSACWGVPLEHLPDFPVYSLLKGMPSGQRPGSYSIEGGLSRYISAFGAELGNVDIRLGVDIRRIDKTDRFHVVAADGQEYEFDQLIVATSSRDAANLLRGVPTVAEMQSVIASFRHWEIDIAIHGDASYMPSDRRDWADNNLFFEGDKAWMSDWPGHRAQVPVIRTWLPKGRGLPTPLYGQRTFHHVLMTNENPILQRRIAALQGRSGLWVTGMYSVDVDNHESALLSGLVPAMALAPDASNLKRLIDAVSRDPIHRLDVLPVPFPVRESAPSAPAALFER